MIKTSKIIVVIGPTAVGKTALSIELAKAFDGEIVCVDSLLVYRDFNIGTAKPMVEERQGVFHHLIDIVDPTETFTAGDFRRRALDSISEIQSRGKRVFLVGGSGLYLKALSEGMFSVPPISPSIKTMLIERLEKEGALALHRELKTIDPQSAEAVHPHDHYRILRSLEVYYGTGKPFSEYKREHQIRKERGMSFEMIKIGLHLPRLPLHERIYLRTLEMLQKGLIEEVQRLKEKYPISAKPFQSVGYKETLLHIKGTFTQEALQEKITQETRLLAKRQMSWFRSDSEVRWFHPDQTEQIRMTII